MRFLSYVAAAAIALAAPQAFASDDCQDGEIVVKFSHVVAATGHPKGDAASLLAERVNAEMNGKMCMEVYPNSQLFNDDKVLEAMLLGDVQLAAPSVSKFETFTKKFRLFDLPFLFDDINAVDRFQASAEAKDLLGSMRRKGVIGLGFWHSGMKQLSANKPLLMPEDAKGLKFRVQPSDVLVAQFEALGASAQKLAFSEVYGALQTGVVDGQENTWSNVYTKKFFEVQDGTTATDHGVLDYLVVTSVDFLDGLPEDVRAQFVKIFDEVTATRNQMVNEIELGNRDKIIAAGGVVRTLTAEQRAAWVEAMKPVWAKFSDEIGADFIAAAAAHNKM